MLLVIWGGELGGGAWGGRGARAGAGDSRVVGWSR